MKEIKEDTKKFYEMWNRQSLSFRILCFIFKPIYKDGFEIGFTNGFEWTIENLKNETNKTTRKI